MSRSRGTRWWFGFSSSRYWRPWVSKLTLWTSSRPDAERLWRTEWIWMISYSGTGKKIRVQTTQFRAHFIKIKLTRCWTEWILMICYLCTEKNEINVIFDPFSPRVKRGLISKFIFNSQNISSLFKIWNSFISEFGLVFQK